jgi:hypothetical protein
VSRFINREAAVEALDDLDQVSIYGDYSGRAMYGATCFGVVVPDAGHAMAWLVSLAERIGADEARGLALAARTDSMGRDLIVYFPGYKLEDAAVLRISERSPDDDVPEPDEEGYR